MPSPVYTGLYLSHFAPEKILAGIKQQVRCVYIFVVQALTAIMSGTSFKIP
jgi:hypothetical protein